MFNKRWLLLLSVLLNSGCFLFGPTYTKPHLYIPQQWPDQAQTKKTETVDLPHLQWWKQFKNADLDQSIQKALQQNNQSQIALANIEYARNQLEQVKLNWVPNLSALAGYSQFPILGNPGNVVIAYPLYVVNILQLYKQQKSAEALYEASIYSQDAVKLVVIAQTSASFFTLMAQNEALDLYNKLLKNQYDYLKITQSQYRSGLAAQDKIDQLKSKINQIEAQVEITRHNISVTKNALHYLFNENPGNIHINTTFKRLDSNALIPANLPANVLNGRPDVRKAEALLKAANADVGATAANLLPTVTLGAYLGAGSTIDGPIKLGEAYISGPLLDLPFFAQINSSKARYKERYIEYVDTIRKALRDVANDFSALSAYSKQLKINTSALMNEKNECHLAAVRYRHGLEDNVDLIKCTIRLTQLELIINQNKLDKMIAIVTLYQDLGGGYHGS